MRKVHQEISLHYRFKWSQIVRDWWSKSGWLAQTLNQDFWWEKYSLCGFTTVYKPKECHMWEEFHQT